LLLCKVIRPFGLIDFLFEGFLLSEKLLIISLIFLIFLYLLIESLCDIFVFLLFVSQFLGEFLEI
jgi:hypothetical protein